MRKWNLIPYILKPSLAVFCNLFPHQVILNPPWSLVKEPYDLSQNSPFPLWKKLLVQISMSSHIYLKRKMTQGLNGRMVQSTKNIKYIKRNLHLNARVWTGEWSAILLKIYIKKHKPLSLSEQMTQGLSGRMECQPPAPGVGKFGEHTLTPSWLPNQMISLILIFGFLCRSSISIPKWPRNILQQCAILHLHFSFSLSIYFW